MHLSFPLFRWQFSGVASGSSPAPLLVLTPRSGSTTSSPHPDPAQPAGLSLWPDLPFLSSSVTWATSHCIKGLWLTQERERRSEREGGIGNGFPRRASLVAQLVKNPPAMRET